MIVRGNCDINKLNYMYDTINRIVTNQNCYYNESEVEKLKKDENNIFLKSSNHKSQRESSSFFMGLLYHFDVKLLTIKVNYYKLKTEGGREKVMADNEVYTTEEVANIFKTSKQKNLNQRKTGTIKAIKIGKRVYFRKEEIERILKENEI